MTQQAAGARAAAYFEHDAHTLLVTSEARALEGLHCVMAPQAAAAKAAAYFPLVALSCLATSVAQAFQFVFWVCTVGKPQPHLELRSLRGILANIFWRTCSSLAGSSLEFFC